MNFPGDLMRTYNFLQFSAPFALVIVQSKKEARLWWPQTTINLLIFNNNFHRRRTTAVSVHCLCHLQNNASALMVGR